MHGFCEPIFSVLQFRFLLSLTLGFSSFYHQHLRDTSHQETTNTAKLYGQQLFATLCFGLTSRACIDGNTAYFCRVSSLNEHSDAHLQRYVKQVSTDRSIYKTIVNYNLAKQLFKKRNKALSLCPCTLECVDPNVVNVMQNRLFST